MSKRKLTLFGLWAAALGAIVILAVSRGTTETGHAPERGQHAPVRRPGTDEAPSESRTELPVSPPPEGPARTFRHDRRHTGRNPYRGPAAPEVAWTVRTGGRITAQPVLDEAGRIYVGSHDGHFYSVDPDGSVRWKTDLRDRVYATAHIDEDGRIYVGSDDNTFWALASDGSVRWRLSTEGDADTGTAMSPQGVLHFAAGKHLWAVEPDGTVKWRFEARSKIFTSPAVDDDGTIYIGSQDDHLYAVASDGRLRWSFATDGDNDSSPVLDDQGRVLFGSDDEHVYAVDRDGALQWKTEVGAYVRTPVALGLDGTLLAGIFGPRPALVALDSSSGTQRWRFDVARVDSSELGINAGVLVDRDGNLYFGAHDDFVYSLSPDGELRWAHGTDGDVDSSPVLGSDGTLYVGSDDHHLYALRRTDG